MWAVVVVMLAVTGCGRLEFARHAPPDGLEDAGDAGADAASDASVATTPQLACGDNHCCLKKANGTVWCWGQDTNGQLGDGLQTDSGTPHQVVGLTDAVAIAAGGQYTCAVRAIAGANLVCWGSNISNPLGTGGASSLVPVTVPVTDVTTISAGGQTTCAGHADGSAHCWGYNYYANIGSGSMMLSSNPTLVPVVSDIAAMTTGNFTCARQRTGFVWCWAYNEYGSVGNGRTLPGAAGDYVGVPTQIASLSDIAEIDAGFYHACVRAAAGTVSCWGLGTAGELGQNDQVTRSSPVLVGGLSNVAAIAAGGYVSCALIAGGTVKCWGDGNPGTIGNGTMNNALVPTSVSNLTDAVQISVGGFFACALRQTGQVACWGSNMYGQIGNGSIGGNVLTPYSGAPL